VVDQEDKVQLIKDLIAMARVDDDFDDRERGYISMVGQKIGLTSDEIKEVITDPDIKEYHLPKTMRERYNYLYLLVSMMMVDGEIDQKEVDYCTAIAKKFGISNPFVIHNMVKKLKRTKT
jgi:uncharacterized tellurite resistance protein B-like protein